MKRKRRVEITIETNQRLVINRTGRTTSALCAECGGPLVTTEEAVAATGISARAIHRRAEAGRIHLDEPPEGYLLICLKSLLLVGWH